MFCTSCGTEIEQEDALFCPQCGSAVAWSNSLEQPAAEAPVSAIVTPDPGVDPLPKKKRSKTIVAVIVAVVIACAGIGIGVWWKLDQDAKAEWERTHAPIATQIILQAPSFDDTATAIPVQVTGTDLDGNKVDEVQFIRPDSMRVETLAGSYSFYFPGGYFTGTGKVVKAPDASLTVNPSIEEPDQSGTESGGSDNGGAAAGAINTNEPIVFTEVPDLEVTPELINDIKQWAERDPQDNGKAGSLGETANDLHNQAVAAEEQRKAEEEAARLAAEAAARRANPESVDGLTSTVVLKGRLVREEWPTSRTMMGWSAVAYFLEFDAPVQATFNANGRPLSETLERVQVAITEQYVPNEDKDLDSITIPEWQPYVGQYIAVRGKLYHTGNAHTLTKALMQNPQLEEIL